MAEITIYHNPRCSKSRQALAILEEKTSDKMVLQIVDYQKSPLTYESLQQLFEQTGLTNAHLLLRSKEPEYIESGLNKQATNAEVLKAISNYPKLLERPLVTNGTTALICRPPELVEQLL